MGVLKKLIGTALLCVLTSGGAQAAEKGSPAPRRDQAREAAIQAKLGALSPEAAPDFQAATAALDLKDWATASAGYRRVLERVPDFDVALRRLGTCLMQTGQVKEGLALMEKALAQERSPENLFSVAQGLAISGKGREKPPREVSSRAFALASEAVRLQPDDPDNLVLKAQIALDLDDRSSFRTTVAELNKRYPDLMATRYLAAIRAALDEEWRTAVREIREAGRLGLPQTAVEQFLATGVGARAKAWTWAYAVAAAVGAWIIGLFALFLAGKTLSSLTLASIERDDPNEAVTKTARKLRAAYRGVVTTAGLYWYVSLPFVAIVVVAASAAVIYGFLVIGRIPIKLVAILAIGAIVSVYAILRSLFIRVRDIEDPGRAVAEKDAPRLWAAVRDVASEVGTRPVDEIWLTPGTDLAVFERGRARERMNDRARRALLLGTGVLDGFEQGAFRAVLAHEYGHFAHRDTAGGDVALRVNNGMAAFFVALANSGFAVWWNLAFQFLRIYDFLFRRVSHGATRLQEVLADRVAIQRYGFEAFRTGLTHVIRKSVLFERLATAEIRQAVEQRRIISNLYSLPIPSDPDVVADIELQVAAALDAKTTEDNTHPGTQDRFRLGRRIHSTATYQARGGVWELFNDPTAVMVEMTSIVAKRVAADTDAPVAG
jgi:Zn-dependent protease with chaperone function